MKCSVRHCTRPVEKYKRLGVCGPCYDREFRRRMRRLSKWAEIKPAKGPTFDLSTLGAVGWKP
jgi:hypothetical protein